MTGQFVESYQADLPRFTSGHFDEPSRPVCSIEPACSGPLKFLIQSVDGRPIMIPTCRPGSFTAIDTPCWRQERADVLLLTIQSLWLSAILVVILPTILAMAGPVLVRRRVDLHKLSANNEVAGFKFATIGVLYAVLLAFAVIIVCERFSDAEKAVAEEAGAGATIYRLADGLGAGPGGLLRDRLTRYLTLAVTDDWPAMARRKERPVVAHALDDLYAALPSFSPGDTIVAGRSCWGKSSTNSMSSPRRGAQDSSWPTVLSLRSFG